MLKIYVLSSGGSSLNGLIHSLVKTSIPFTFKFIVKIILILYIESKCVGIKIN